MAELDVSDAVLSFDLVDSPFRVLRRSEQIEESSGFADIRYTVFPRVIGVVCAADANSLDAGSDESHQEKAISIVTNFPLRGIAPGMQPDIVVWHGDNYKVVKVEDYSAYGPGFIQAVAHSIDAADIGPQTYPPTMGETIFTTEANSGLIAAL